MSEEIKDKIDAILIELQKDIEAAVCVGPASEFKDGLDAAIAKARVKIQDIN